MPGRFKDISGQRFGRLVVLRRCGYTETTVKPHILWECRCDCGKICAVRGSVLRAGVTRSCGCLVAEHLRDPARRGKGRTRHGHARTRQFSGTYSSWQAMIHRCENIGDKFYSRYGGRGIKVAPELRTFEGFLAHLGERPKGMSLGRIDNDRGYEPGNVRWEFNKSQANNKSNTRRWLFQGESLTISEWSDRTGILKRILTWRLYVGKWDIERALTEKPQLKIPA